MGSRWDMQEHGVRHLVLKASVKNEADGVRG